MPGLPGPLLGRTNDLAWGATYTYMDAVDSWVEECRDGGYRRIESDGERWVEFRTRTETIRRKGKPDEVLTVHENDHGVLDGDPHEPGRYLATKWSSAGTGAASLKANIGMFRASGVEQGRALLGSIETAWNWVLADRHGSIGYQMSGLSPRRRPGAGGMTPLPGWDPANDWQGFAPPEDLPRAIDPERGFIVTANNDLNDLGRTRPIGVSMGGYRAGRITRRIAERTDWTVEETQRLQMEAFSSQAEQMMVLIAPHLPETPQGRALRAWDLRYEPESVGATLFEAVYAALLSDVFGRVIGQEPWEHLASETAVVTDYFASFDAVLMEPESPWWQPEGQNDLCGRAVRRALEGAELQPWGERNSFVMRHILVGDRVPSRLGFSRGPFSLRGGRATIHQGQLYRSGGRQTSFAPSYRLVTDLSTEEAWTCLAGGPSDRRLSRWYANGIADWLAGRFKRVAPR
jgi:penicillin amidase